MTEETEGPNGELSLRTLAMPADTNPSGDIFGGWLLAQMDIAGGLAAKQRARGARSPSPSTP
jgi:acyl-CoA thioesterase YciA